MKINRLYIILISVISTVLCICYYTNEYFSISKRAAEILPTLFIESKNYYIEKEVIKTPCSGSYSYTPEDFGKRKKITAVYADTTFTYMSKIVDLNTFNSNVVQTYLIDKKHLSLDTLNLVFDSICQYHNLYIKSAIGVTADFYTKYDSLSRDTANMRIDYQTSITNEGDYEDIDYTAYIQLTPYTYWKAMPKEVLCVTVGILLLMLIIYGIQKRSEEEKNEQDITSQSNYTYPLGNCMVDFEEKMIATAEYKTVKLTPQSNQLLKMFLTAPDNQVKKVDIIDEFWSDSTKSSAISSMTTAIKRLRDILIVDTQYTIRTDYKNEYYILAKKQEESILTEDSLCTQQDSH